MPDRSILTVKHIRLVRCVLLVFFFSGCISPSGIGLVPNRQLRVIGTMGNDPGQFLEPRQITLTPFGTMLISDFRNYRIQELSLDGNQLNSWGRRGRDPGRFEDPTAAVMDSQGNLYVVDTWNHRIQRYDSSSGEWDASWISADFFAPRGIAIDKDNLIYITNTSRHSVLIVDRDGKPFAEWGTGQPGKETFMDPVGIAVGSDGKIYVADTGNNRIKVMDRSGRTIRLIEVLDWKYPSFVEGYIAIDTDGMLYVTSPNNHKVIVFSPSGELISRFGVYGFGPEELHGPTGIAVTPDKQILVSDTKNNRVVLYAPAPELTNLNKTGTQIDTVIAAIRLILDILALGIIISWIRSKLKHRRIKKKKGFVERLQGHPAVCRVLCVSGLLLTAIAMLGLRLTGFTWLSGILLVVSFVMLAAGFLPTEPVPPSMPVPLKNSRRFHTILLVIVFLFALGIRFHRLDTVPTGINNDAAWNAIYAYRILDGEPYTPFTWEAWGKETFYFYLLALSFKLFGTSVYSLYLPSILANFLTVVILYFLCRDLWNRDIALGAAVVYAILSWNLTFSRTGYRSILAPLFLVLMGWFFYRAVDSRARTMRLLYYSGAGLAIGAGLHTYFSFRGIPFMMIIIGIHTWLVTPRFMRRNWWGLLAMQVCAWLVFLPMLLYALDHMTEFLGRSSFLFVGNRMKFTGTYTPFWSNFIGNLQIFHYHADVGNFFEKAIPIVSVPVGFLLVPGLAYAFGHMKSRGGFWIVMTALFGLLPGVLSEPDAGRNILFTVPLAISTSLGLVYFSGLLTSGGFLSWKKATATASFFCGLIFVVICEYVLYFHVQARSSHAQFGYAYTHTQLGYEARDLSKDYHVYVSNSLFLDTPKFLCYRIPGDVFAITKNRELTSITNEELIDNLHEIRAKEHSPDKGIAFVLDHFHKNQFVMQQIRLLFPGISTRPVFDNTKPEHQHPMYYVMTLPPEKRINSRRL
jgi:sugar lactone lactonase YvrE/4-amino-4-deoxy-L-arabinose transferase-like glycosyltransferase